MPNPLIDAVIARDGKDAYNAGLKQIQDNKAKKEAEAKEQAEIKHPAGLPHSTLNDAPESVRKSLESKPLSLQQPGSQYGQPAIPKAPSAPSVQPFGGGVFNADDALASKDPYRMMTDKGQPIAQPGTKKEWKDSGVVQPYEVNPYKGKAVLPYSTKELRDTYVTLQNDGRFLLDIRGSKIKGANNGSRDFSVENFKEVPQSKSQIDNYRILDSEGLSQSRKAMGKFYNVPASKLYGTPEAKAELDRRNAQVVAVKIIGLSNGDLSYNDFQALRRDILNGRGNVYSYNVADFIASKREQKGNILADHKAQGNAMLSEMRRLQSDRQKATGKKDYYHPTNTPIAVGPVSTSDIADAHTFVSMRMNRSLDMLDIVEKKARGKNGWFSIFGEGVGEGLANELVSSVPLGQVRGSDYIQKLIKRYNKGEKLNKEDSALLDAFAYSNTIDSEMVRHIPASYKIGETTGASIPFMIDFLAANAVAGVGEIGAKVGAKLTQKTFQAMLRNGILDNSRGLTRFGAKLLGGVARVATDAGVAGIMTAANPRQMGKIDSNAYEMLEEKPLASTSRSGAPKFGGVTLAPQETSEAKAFAKSFTDQWLENWSEMAGGWLGDIGKGAKNFGKAIVGGAFNDVKKAVPQMMANYGSSSIGGALTQVYKAAVNIGKKAGFNGVVEENLEEYFGNAGRVMILGGDHTWDKEFSPEQIKETFVGLLPTMLMFGAIGGVSTAGQHATSAKQLKEYEDKLKARGIDTDKAREQMSNMSFNEYVQHEAALLTKARIKHAEAEALLERKDAGANKAMEAAKEAEEKAMFALYFAQYQGVRGVDTEAIQEAREAHEREVDRSIDNSVKSVSHLLSQEHNPDNTPNPTAGTYSRVEHNGKEYVVRNGKFKAVAQRDMESGAPIKDRNGNVSYEIDADELLYLQDANGNVVPVYSSDVTPLGETIRLDGLKNSAKSILMSDASGGIQPSAIIDESTLRELSDPNNNLPYVQAEPSAFVSSEEVEQAQSDIASMEPQVEQQEQVPQGVPQTDIGVDHSEETPIEEESFVLNDDEEKEQGEWDNLDDFDPNRPIEVGDDVLFDSDGRGYVKTGVVSQVSDDAYYIQAQDGGMYVIPLEQGIWHNMFNRKGWTPKEHNTQEQESGVVDTTSPEEVVPEERQEADPQTAEEWVAYFDGDIEAAINWIENTIHVLKKDLSKLEKESKQVNAGEAPSEYKARIQESRVVIDAIRAKIEENEGILSDLQSMLVDEEAEDAKENPNESEEVSETEEDKAEPAGEPGEVENPSEETHIEEENVPEQSEAKEDIIATPKDDAVEEEEPSTQPSEEEELEPEIESETTETTISPTESEEKSQKEESEDEKTDGGQESKPSQEEGSNPETESKTASEVLDEVVAKNAKELEEKADVDDNKSEEFPTQMKGESTTKDPQKGFAKVDTMSFMSSLSRGGEAKLSDHYEADNDKGDSVPAFAVAVRDDILKSVDSGTKPYSSISDLRKRAKEVGMDVDSEGRNDIQIQELAELGLVLAAREIVKRHGANSRESYDAICRLYDVQPTISMRSGNRIKMQQYSTPLPMGWLASRFVLNGNKDAKVFEPTAGNGMFVFAVPEKQVYANELDETRVSMLEKQGLAKVTSQDATLPFEGEELYDGVIANPPFGSSGNVFYDGINVSGLAPQIALNALSKMADNGRAAIIIGGNTTYEKNGAIKDNKGFFAYLYDHYNVQGVIDMDGDIYAKQGTKYPTRMILINGRRSEEERKNSRIYPPVQSKSLPKSENFSDLYDTVNRIINSNEKTNGYEVLRSEGGGHESDSNDPSRGANGDGHLTESSTNDGTRQQDEDGASTSVVSSNDKGSSDVLGESRQVSVTSETGNDVDSPRESRDDEGGTRERSLSAGAEGLANVEVRLDKEEKKRSITDEKLPYRPYSGAFSLESVAPAAMVEAMDSTLSKIEYIHGNIDEFVREELGYETTEELHNALAAEQVDSVAMAIYQMSQGNALIIGDQTGVGKGRQMAALIRWATRQGVKPIFITQKADLFSDIYRDLSDIGSGGLVPFIFNSSSSSSNRGEMVDVEGNVVYKSLPNAKLKKVFEGGTLPEGYDYAVLTYSQVNTGDEISRTESKRGGASTRSSSKAQFLRSISKGNYIFLDESHTASGDGNVGSFIKSILSDVKGATFASATFAKRPDSMPIYAIRTSINKANIDQSELIDIVQKGGVTLQEIMSRELTNAGQMVRRERDMDGVVTDWKVIDDKTTTERARSAYDSTIKAFNAIIKFQKEYVEPFINNKSIEAASMMGSAKSRKNKNLGFSSTPFASKAYNYTKQLMLAIKAESIVEEVVSEIKNGRHPVVALESTMESSLSDYSEGEVITSPTFSSNLLRGLKSVLSYNFKDAGLSMTLPISLSELDSDARQAYEELERFIVDSTKDIYMSPIDLIIEELNKRGYSVGELTGRSLRIEKQEDGTAIVRKRTNNDKKKMQREFNSGSLDVLILNKSASTGISLHASSKFQDQRQRSMIIAQPLSDINDYMQMMGRIDRTGQVHRGYYINLGLPIPAETRFLMMLSTKLKSLNANTTTSQDNESSNVDAPDILNKYGDKIVIEYLRDNYDIYEKLGLPLGGKEILTQKELDEYVAQENDARRVTGYVALLSTDEQEAFYKDVIQRYNDLISYLDETNSNELRISVMPLRAKTLEKRVSSKGIDASGNNPFAQDSYVEKVEMDVLRKPMKASEVKKLIEKSQKEHSIEDIHSTISKEREEKYAKEIDRYEREKERIEESIKAYSDRILLQDRNESEKQDIIKKHADTTRAKVSEKHNENVARINGIESFLNKAIGSFKAGNIYLVPDDFSNPETSSSSLAVFYGYKVKKSGITPATTFSCFATMDGRVRVEVKSTQSDVWNAIIDRTNLNWGYINKFSLDNWDTQIPSETRKTGYIITGNILQSIASTQTDRGGYVGHLVSYTDDSGNIHDGILMPDRWEPRMLRHETSPILSRLQQIKEREPITSNDGKLKLVWSNSYSSYLLSVPKSKREGAIFFQNDVLNGASSSGFYQFGNNFRADIPEERIEEVVYELSELGVMVSEPLKNMDFDRGNRENHEKSDTGTITRLVDQLKKSGLAEDVVVDKEAFERRLEEVDHVQFLKDGEQVYGFVSNGVVYLNPDLLNTNTPIHEFAHLWNSLIKEKEPELWNEGVGLVKDSSYMDEVRNNPYYSQLSEEDQLDEAMAMAIGDFGAKEIESKGVRGASLRAWIGKVWDKIRSFLGVPKREYKNLDDFARTALNDILGGERLGEVVFSPTQIKSATDNVGSFDGNVEDIRFRRSETPLRESDGDIFVRGQISPNLPENFQSYHFFYEPGLDYIYADSTEYYRLESIYNENGGHLPEGWEYDFNPEDFRLKEGYVCCHWSDEYEYPSMQQGAGDDSYCVFFEGDEVAEVYDGVVAHIIRPLDSWERQKDGTYKRIISDDNIRERTLEQIVSENGSAYDTLYDRAGVEQKAKSVADKLSVPTDVKVKSKHEVPRSARNTKGYYDPKSGEVVVVLENVSSREDLEKTILHEVIGHKGLDALIPEADRDAFFNGVYNLLSEEQLLPIMARYPNAGKRELAEEFIAHLAEGYVHPTLITRVSKAIRSLLRSLGFNLRLTDGEVMTLLYRGSVALKRESATAAQEIAYINQEKAVSESMSYMDRLNAMSLDELRDEVGENGVKLAQRMRLLESLGESERLRYRADEAFKEIDVENVDRSAVADSMNKAFTGKKVGEHKIPTWTQFLEETLDDLISLRKYQENVEKSIGKKLPSYLNIDKVFNQMSSRAAAAEELLVDIFEKEVGGVIRKLEKEKKITYRDIQLYVMAKHAIERNQVKRQKEIEKLSNPTSGDIARIMQQDFSSELDIQYGIEKHLKGSKNPIFSNVDGIRSYIEAIENSAGKDIDALWSSINKLNGEALKMWHEAGMISKDHYNNIKKLYKYYVPLQGIDDETIEDVWTYYGVSNRGNYSLVKDAEGRNKLPDNPFMIMRKSISNTAYMAEHNKAKIVVLALAQTHPTDYLIVRNSWDVLTTDANGREEWKEVMPESEEGAVTEESMIAFEEKMQALEEEGKAKRHEHEPISNIGGYRVSNRNTLEEHLIRVSVNGKEQVVFVNGSPSFSQAVNRENRGKEREFLSKVAMVTRLKAAFATSLSIPFAFTNGVRDLLWSLSSSGIRYGKDYEMRFVRYYGRAGKFLFSTEDKQDEGMKHLWDEFKRNGGRTGYASMVGDENARKLAQKGLSRGIGKRGVAARAVNKAGNAISYLGETIEDLTRFAAYCAAREGGKSVTDSIDVAKEMTVNFNRRGKGSSLFMRSIFSFYMFINANIQGMAQLVKMFKNHPVGTSVMAGAYAMLPMFSAILTKLIGDDDDYFALSDYERTHNLIICLGSGKFIKVPMPQEMYPFLAIGNSISELAFGESSVTDALLGSVDGILDGATFGLDASSSSLKHFKRAVSKGEENPTYLLFRGFVPSILQPATDVWNNWDYVGRHIEKPSYGKNTPKYQRVYENKAWGWLVGLSKAINGDDIKGRAMQDDGIIGAINSPANAQYLIESWLGGIVSTIAKDVRFAEDLFRGENFFESASHAAVLGRFIHFDSHLQEKKMQSDFYKAKEEIGIAQKKINEIQKGIKANEEAISIYEEEGNYVMVGILEKEIEDAEADIMEITNGKDPELYKDASDMFKDYSKEQRQLRELLNSTTDEELRSEIQEQIYNSNEEIMGYYTDLMSD